MKNVFILLMFILLINCVAADNNFYGTWVIDKPFHIMGVLGDVDEEYESIKGITITYTEDKFILNSKTIITIIKNPYYEEEIWDEEYLFDMTKGSATKPVTFEDLEIPVDQKTIIRIRVKDENKRVSMGTLVSGTWFYVINHDTLILYWEGQHFKMKRR